MWRPKIKIRARERVLKDIYMYVRMNMYIYVFAFIFRNDDTSRNSSSSVKSQLKNTLSRIRHCRIEIVCTLLYCTYIVYLYTSTYVNTFALTGFLRTVIFPNNFTHVLQFHGLLFYNVNACAGTLGVRARAHIYVRFNTYARKVQSGLLTGLTFYANKSVT